MFNKVVEHGYDSSYLKRLLNKKNLKTKLSKVCFQKYIFPNTLFQSNCICQNEGIGLL